MIITHGHRVDLSIFMRLCTFTWTTIERRIAYFLEYSTFTIPPTTKCFIGISGARDPSGQVHTSVQYTLEYYGVLNFTVRKPWNILAAIIRTRRFGVKISDARGELLQLFRDLVSAPQPEFEPATSLQ